VVAKVSIDLLVGHSIPKMNSTRTAVPSHYCKHRMGTDQPLSVDL